MSEVVKRTQRRSLVITSKKASRITTALVVCALRYSLWQVNALLVAMHIQPEGSLLVDKKTERDATLKGSIKYIPTLKRKIGEV